LPFQGGWPLNFSFAWLGKVRYGPEIIGLSASFRNPSTKSLPINSEPLRSLPPVFVPVFSHNKTSMYPFTVLSSQIGEIGIGETRENV